MRRATQLYAFIILILLIIKTHRHNSIIYMYKKSVLWVNIKSKIIDNEFEIDVRTDRDNGTVWLTQDEMAL